MQQRYSDKSDFELWEAIRTNGDKEAFSVFYKNHATLLFKYGYSIYANEAHIYDCIQELFMNIWLKRKSISFESSPKNYLLISLRRLILKKKPKDHTVKIEDLDELEKAENTFSEEVSKMPEIKRVLQSLPERQKEAVYLKYMENLPYEEIASIMNITIPSVYKAVSAGIKKIRQKMLFF